MKVFILAAGKQVRFPANYTPKQLLEVGGETILQRQLRQSKAYGHTPTVITKNEKIIAQAPNHFEPAKFNSVLESLISIKSMWENRVVYLLGDVFYSINLFKSIMEDDSDLRFWMSGSEIFALSFKSINFKNIENAVSNCLKHDKKAKIWHLYRFLNKIPLRTHFILPEQEKVVDYTFDIDSEIQYHDVRKYINLLKETMDEV